jgi:TetR/AcrR family transcriptional repressor of nem operon
MPRVSRQVARENHDAILKGTAQLMRERGLSASLADIMAAAGLTPGGFYGHFASKDELLAQGCRAAFAESARRWHVRAGGARDTAAALDAVVQGYLAEDGPFVSGCPIASLATDVSREAEGPAVGNAFRDGISGLLEILVGLQPEGRPQAARKAALIQLSTMVGALVLARALRGDALAHELLGVARSHLKSRRAPARLKTPPRQRTRP